MAKRKAEKRVKKEDLYREYGIEYKDNKIKDPIGNYVPLPITVGTNTKLGKGVGSWSIYHGNETHTINEFGAKAQQVMKDFGVTEFTGSCPMHCNGCYCDNGRYPFDQNRATAIRKLLYARLYMGWLKKAIIAQIKIEGIKQLRIHAQGDFFSADYSDMWKDIAVECKECCIFWTYTKEEHALEALQGISNLSIVPSCTPYGLNFGTAKELVKLYERLVKDGYRVHICACGTDYQKHCSECKCGCKAIGKECDFVLFIKHSTRDYDFSKDTSVYHDMVLDIIRKQDN